MSFLGCVVVFCTTYALILPAITQEQVIESFCDIAEHIHEDSCYAVSSAPSGAGLVCSYESLNVHQHDAACYDENVQLVCGQADYIVHIHDSYCFDDAGQLICTLAQIEAHEHTELCYQSREAHVHDDACYTVELGEVICGLTEQPEHVHDESCSAVQVSLTCSLAESHTHDDTCYSEHRPLVCGYSHVHVEECYVPGDNLICEEGHVHSDVCYELPQAVICAYVEEHTHDDGCYAYSEETHCGEEENHVHDGACYAQERALLCGVDQEHAHDAACYGNGALICTHEQNHVHSDSCYEAEGALLCGQAQHSHGSECYEEDNLKCTAEEHEHADACYAPRSLTCTEIEGHVHETACHEQTLQCQMSEHAHNDTCYAEPELLCTMAEGHVHTDACRDLALQCQKDEHVHESACYGEPQLVCGQSDEHVHGDSCYESVLACSEGDHVHDDTCYGEHELLCGEEENHIHGIDCFEQTVLCSNEQAHTHADECYEQMKVLICALDEGEAQTVLVCGTPQTHVHSDACFGKPQDEIICGLDEDESHTHSALCYNEWELICTQDEHVHELICFSDPYADVEGESAWKRSFSHVKLTGIWEIDVLAIAETQLGYKESTRNYIVLEDGETIRGYTRYGEWYGAPYSDWCAMFASFCLHYAKVPGIPLEAHCQKWINKLSAPSVDLYRPAQTYTPRPGDLIFFDYDLDGQSDHVGFVYEAGSQIVTISGNSQDCVRKATYDADAPSIMGYGRIPVILDQFDDVPEDIPEKNEDSDADQGDNDDLDENKPVIHEHAEACYNDLGYLVCPLLGVGDIAGTGNQDEAEDTFFVQQTNGNEGKLPDETEYFCDLGVHAHEAGCHDAEGNLICKLEEHEHSEACLAAPVYYCCLEEHVHEASCSDAEGNLICELPEHAHSEACLEDAKDEEPEVEVYFCGLEEHMHEAACYDAEGNLVCELPEHVHSEACLEEPEAVEYFCGVEEHMHEEACYDADGNLLCEQVEHVHSDVCLVEPVVVYYCGHEEHEHNENCYDADSNLLCEQAEHVHSDVCLVEPVVVYYCGHEEHEHNENCYDVDSNLICEQVEHVHSEACLEEPEVVEYFCGLEEHMHEAACYDEEGNLICELPEHAHSEACLEEAKDEEPEVEVYFCGLEEHMHEAACYDAEGNLVCELPEHVHSEACLEEAKDEESEIEADEHEHTEACYDEQGGLICETSESVDDEELEAVEYFCGLEEHMHEEACYDAEGNLLCEQVEHAHSEACLEELEAVEYFCGLEEYMHEEACYDAEGNLLCEQVEHVHSDACLAAPVYYCGVEEHMHEATCYDAEGNLLCEQVEHAHSEACLEEPEAVEYFCGVEEHMHEASCSDAEGNLICELPEHAHSEACLEEAKEEEPEVEVYFCGVEEHMHEEACSDAEGNLVCELPEHVHSEACLEEPEVVEYFCGLEEHMHEASCSDAEGNLICELPEHAHSEACLEEAKDEESEVEVYFCGVEEHMHEAACYDADGNVFCELPEHVHSEACLEELDNAGYMCGVEEHMHEEACYDAEGNLVCELPEHVHSEACLEEPEVVEYFCGLEEHMHEAACYDEEGNLVCELPEHAHSEACLEEPEAVEYFCGLEEHMHEAACYDADGNLLCEQVEHVHSEACLEESEAVEYFCGLEEHMHEEACYDVEGNLVCELPEHAHSEVCLEEPEAVEYFCGLEEHMHEAVCYDAEGNLICELPEHVHSEACLEEPEAVEYFCGLEEHMHEEACYDADGNLVCELLEHAHSEACLEEPEAVEYFCGLEEHMHEASCYDADGNLVCGLPEHAHSEACLEELERCFCGLYVHIHEEKCYAADGSLICPIPEHIHMMTFAARALGKEIGKTVSSIPDALAENAYYVVYTVVDGIPYAFDGKGKAIPIAVDENGTITTDAVNEYELLWTFTSAGGNSYHIQNMVTALYMHAYNNNNGSDTRTITIGKNPSVLEYSEDNATVKVIGNNAYARLNEEKDAFVVNVDENGNSSTEGVAVFSLGILKDYPALTAPICGVEPHRHDKECYDTARDKVDAEPVCEKSVHIHSVECYENEGYPCGVPRHAHDETCNNGNCGKVEHEHKLPYCYETRVGLTDTDKPSVNHVIDLFYELPDAADIEEEDQEEIRQQVKAAYDAYQNLPVHLRRFVAIGWQKKLEELKAFWPEERTEFTTELGQTMPYDSKNGFTLSKPEYQFVIYTKDADGAYYAFDGNGRAIPIQIDEDGNITSNLPEEEKNLLLWTITPAGVIKNLNTGRHMHAFHNSETDYGVTTSGGWGNKMHLQGDGSVKIEGAGRFAQLVVDGLNPEEHIFVQTSNAGDAAGFYFGFLSTGVYVWLDGTNGGLMSLGDSPNTGYLITDGHFTLPETWTSSTKYGYKLKGWYDVMNKEYYSPGTDITVDTNRVFYAEWEPVTYNVGKFNEFVSDQSISTSDFITTRVYDYNVLFNAPSLDVDVAFTPWGHMENWKLTNEDPHFIFNDYDDNWVDMSYPADRDTQNQNQNEITPNIYTSELVERLFGGQSVWGKQYVGTGDWLFSYGTDPADTEHYGFYYYDSRLNAASYNKSAGRFYVYDYLERTTDSRGGDASIGAYSDFLPFNSPYVKPTDKELPTYEYGGTTNYQYDAKYDDSGDGVGNAANHVATNYWFGMKTEIEFFLPNQPGSTDSEGNLGNLSVYGEDLIFEFAGDDDVWVLVDDKLVLDIGGIHGVRAGKINFSTGKTITGEIGVLTQAGTENNNITRLGPGRHTLTMYYLERGASQSNCMIRFNICPRYGMELRKEDVLNGGNLDGAQFSVFTDEQCTTEAELWPSEAAYKQDDQSTHTFTVQNGVAKMWGFAAGTVYYIKETKAPDAEGYDLPKGIIKMTGNNKGTATFEILPGEDEQISGGFTVYGESVDHETKKISLTVTNGKNITDTTAIYAEKRWEDAVDHSAQNVTIHLLADGKRIREEVLSADNDWRFVWDNLPKYKEDGETKVQYTVEEDVVSSYTGEVEEIEYRISDWEEAGEFTDQGTYLLKSDDGYLMASDYMLGWVPDELTARTSAAARWKATGTGGTVTLINEIGQAICFSNGEFYAATLIEGGAELSYEGSALVCSGYGMGTVHWDGRASSIGPHDDSGSDSEAGEGEELEAVSPLRFTLLQETFKEEKIDGYAYLITNKPIGKQERISLTVHKAWNKGDFGTDAMYQQMQIKVRLLVNGTPSSVTRTLYLKNGWTATFEDLPAKDSKGQKIDYTVEEIGLTGPWVPEYGDIKLVKDSTDEYETIITNVCTLTYELPATGGIGTYPYTLGGILLLAVGAILLYRKQIAGRRGVNLSDP